MLTERKEVRKMKVTYCISGIGKIVFQWAVVLAVMLFTSSAFSEMRVTTDDGRIIRVPVKRSEVKNIEFTEDGYPSGSVQSIGCFYDYKDGIRDLSGYSFNGGDMTTEKCIATCQSKGFSYAGTQFSSYCFCGNSYGRFGKSDQCNMRCTGNQNEICGGSHANSIYKIR
jgi:hypothetical protein